MIINKSNLTNLNTGFKATFRNGFGAVALAYTRIATVVPSSTSIETYAWLGDFAGMREWIGDRHRKNLGVEGYTLANRLFEDTVEVPRTSIEDDQYGIFSPAIGMMATAAAEHPEQLVFVEALPGGFAAKCFDGQNFFDADHPVMVNGEEVSVSNMQAGALSPWYLLCTKRPVKPFIYQDRVKPELIIHDDPATSESVFERDKFTYGTRSRGAAGYAFWQMAFGSKADLTAANFEAARTAMMSLKGNNGRPLGIVPDLLVIPPSLEKKADEILSVQRLENGSDNPNYKKAEILNSPWLA
ncbi:hypothetical protein ASD64_07115 [Mesorhizobium sp. Root157]|uniref:Mu-like prophage major head subunit gpT family protein n=1 Tax=Mesorhizobium sp. Root157 TaxID=1736477 RepID=UPI0006F4869F|nr:Mu-like prophage major head subunit gpT family protein [Mesorhizobium sp. Root157]KQZ87204.1 hypothetical protein ASD64_07115 [Mesorhizobium sp. Root157]